MLEPRGFRVNDLAFLNAGGNEATTCQVHMDDVRRGNSPCTAGFSLTKPKPLATFASARRHLFGTHRAKSALQYFFSELLGFL